MEAFERHAQRINEMSSMGPEERKYRIAKLLEQTPSKMKVKEPTAINRESSSTYHNDVNTNGSILAGEDRASYNTGKSDHEEKPRGPIPEKKSLASMEEIKMGSS